MQIELPEEFLSFYRDPWGELGFEGLSPPIDRAAEEPVLNGVAELKAKFRAVYARRNAVETALAKLSPGDPKREELLRQSAKLTEAIDTLEDACSPIGFIAEPVFGEGVYVRELVFTYARKSRPEPRASASSFSLYISIPLDDIQKELGDP